MDRFELEKLYGEFDDFLFGFGPKGSCFGERKSYALVRQLEDRIKSTIFPMIERKELSDALALTNWIYEKVLRFYLYDYSWEAFTEIIALVWFRIRAKATPEFLEEMNATIWELRDSVDELFSEGGMAVWCYLEEILETEDEKSLFLDWTRKIIRDEDPEGHIRLMLLQVEADLMQELGYPEDEIEAIVEECGDLEDY